MSTKSIDQEIELVSVPMDKGTRERLEAFARATGTPAIEAAAALFRDLLTDDEFWNAAAVERKFN